MADVSGFHRFTTSRTFTVLCVVAVITCFWFLNMAAREQAAIRDRGMEAAERLERFGSGPRPVGP